MAFSDGLSRPVQWMAAASLAASIILALRMNRNPDSNPRTILPSPRTTLLPQLTSDQAKSLGYPPDALPGARDVSTPYGSIRVYEWGPSDGKKVIMTHGDATPSPLFTRIAKVLTARGCRVLTFDLWGRGYSDTPSGNQHNSRLYMQQILYAITSSPIQWTGPTRFSMIGFSLGGAITLDFFAHHPSLVEDLVLLGPAGLLRNLPPVYKSFYFHHASLASKSKMRRLIGAVLGVDTSNLKPESADIKTVEKPEGFTPTGALQFQFDYHAGHVESMWSTIAYGPIQHEHETWIKAGKIISGESSEDTPLCGGKILVICGADDTVIPPAHTKDDLTRFLGPEGKHWQFDTVPGGHEFPWPQGENVGTKIAQFWNLKEASI